MERLSYVVSGCLRGGWLVAAAVSLGCGQSARQGATGAVGSGSGGGGPTSGGSSAAGFSGTVGGPATGGGAGTSSGEVGGAGGLGDGGRGASAGLPGQSGAAGFPVVPEPEATVSQAYTWSECGRLPPVHPHGTVAYGADGTLVHNDAGGHLVFRAAGDLHVLNELVAGAFGLSLDGSLLARASREGVTVHELPGDTLVTELLAPEGGCPIEQLRFSSAGDRVMSYGKSGLCAWELPSGVALAKLSEPIASAAFSADAIVVTTGLSGLPEIVRFDLQGQELARFAPEIPEQSQLMLDAFLSVSPSGTVVAGPIVTNNESFASLFDAEDGALLWSRPETLAAIVPPVFSPAGDLVLMGDVFDASNGETAWETGWLEYSMAFPAAGTTALAPSGREVTALFGGQFAVVRDGGLPRLLGGHELASPQAAQPPRSLAVTPDGKTLVSLAQQAIRWELADRFEDSIPSMAHAGPYLSRVEVSPDGRWASFAGDGHSVVSLEGPGRIWSGVPGSGDVSCVWLQYRFSPDGQWLAGSSYEHALELFRVSDFPAAASSTTRTLVPAWQSPERGCPTLASLPAGYPLSLDGDGSGTSAWPRLDAGLEPPNDRTPFDDYVVAPNGRESIQSSRCEPTLDQTSEAWAPYSCSAELSTERWGGSRSLPELTAPFPSFSPEGHWVVAGPTLVHLPSREVRELDAAALVAIFLPNGDVIAGERDGSLARYCRATTP